jgi:hypothetical protein
MLKIYQCQLGDKSRGYLTVSYISSEEDEFDDDHEFAEWLKDYIIELKRDERLDFLHAEDEDPVEAAFLLEAALATDGYAVDFQLQMPKIELVDLDVAEE